MTIGFQEESADPSAIFLVDDPGYEEETHCFMQESLFVLPETFEEDEKLLDQAVRDSDNPDVIYVAGDIPEDIELDADEAVAICANYTQVRNFLQKNLEGGLVVQLVCDASPWA